MTSQSEPTRNRTWPSAFAGLRALRHTPGSIAFSIPAGTRTRIGTFGERHVSHYTTRITFSAAPRSRAGSFCSSGRRDNHLHQSGNPEHPDQDSNLELPV